MSVVALQSPSFAETIPIPLPAWQLGVFVQDLKSGKEVYTHKPNLLLKPASVQKLFITYVALKKLHPQATFSTEIYFTKDEDLIVKGYGDPSFTTEDLYQIASYIAGRGILKIHNIFVDDSYFSDAVVRSGGRAYLAGGSALSLNYNAAAILVCGSHAEVLPIGAPFEAIINKKKNDDSLFVSDISEDGKVVVSGGASSGHCKTSYKSVPNPSLYVGTVLVSMLKNFGVSIRGKVSQKSDTDTSSMPLLYAHESKSLGYITSLMNQYSNNFIADELAAHLGCSEHSCSLQEGLRQLKQFLLEKGVVSQDAAFFDGSGLSHKNLASALQIGAAIKAAYEDDEVHAEFLASLAQAGRNGTLKERDFGDSGILFRGKTGSLDGVSTLAGILKTRKGTLLSVVVFGNKIASKSEAVSFENSLVKFLYDHK